MKLEKTNACEKITVNTATKNTILSIEIQL